MIRYSIILSNVRKKQNNALAINFLPLKSSKSKNILFFMFFFGVLWILSSFFFVLFCNLSNFHQLEVINNTCKRFSRLEHSKFKQSFLYFSILYIQPHSLSRSLSFSLYFIPQKATILKKSVEILLKISLKMSEVLMLKLGELRT
jgi:hypothetical protein